LRNALGEDFDKLQQQQQKSFSEKDLQAQLDEIVLKYGGGKETLDQELAANREKKEKKLILAQKVMPKPPAKR
jgi:hypothetical protein